MKRYENFNKMLDLIGLSRSDEYSNGCLNKLTVDKNEFSVDVYVSFDKIISPEGLGLFQKTLKEKFIENKIGKKVNLNIEFIDKFMSDDLANKYYEYVLDTLCDARPRFSALKIFKTFVDNEQVIFLVANENEKKLIESLVEGVQLSYQRLGLSFIKFEVRVNDLIVPISREIEISIIASNEEKMRAQEEFEAQNQQTKIDINKPIKQKKMASPINDEATPLGLLPSTEYNLADFAQKKGTAYITIQAEVKTYEMKILKGDLRLYTARVTDDTGAIIVKGFINQDQKKKIEYFENNCNVGNLIRVYGVLEYDKFSRDVVLKYREVVSYGKVEKKIKHEDRSMVKRVELHAHSKMTILDSTLEISEYVQRAVEYGHHALALTDKFNVQGLPKFNKELSKTDILPIFGMEAAFVDEECFNIALTKQEKDINLDEATYVVYDLETTGLYANFCSIIEIAACKIYKGEIIEEFSTYVNPHRKIPAKITELTSIKDDDVRYAPSIEEALPKFKKFYEGSIIVAHNATFDTSYLYRNLESLGMDSSKLPTIDTLQLARVLLDKKLKKFNLDAICKELGVDLEKHHRAIYDARATAYCFIKMFKTIKDMNINTYNQINSLINENEVYKHAFPTHITILAKNRIGLINLNKLVSISYTENFCKEPRILKKKLLEHREGLLIGSCCYKGEIFEKALNNTYQDLKDAVPFYDFLEVQPPEVYGHIVTESCNEVTIDDIRSVIKTIIKVGHECNIPVCATGDVHHLEPEDNVYRRMLLEKPMVGGGLHDLFHVTELPKQHFRSTDEMLNDFSYLGTDEAYEIVVKNTNLIANMITKYDLFPKKLFAPGDDAFLSLGVKSAKDEVMNLAYSNAKAQYGEVLPKFIKDRLDKELNSIIGHGYATVYYISYLLVKHSKDAGYVVGSRGSVGSSVVAYFMGITEVNAFAPHYLCPHCKFTAFKLSDEEKRLYSQDEKAQLLEKNLQDANTGFDLPPSKCPICGEELIGTGSSIPFETFMGFSGEKLPDIDLNFSGEYQAKAHDFCREIFGVENTYRGGTIGCIAETTAFGYIRGHYETLGKVPRKCELEEMVPKLIDVKRTTGQHPGGIIVVPNNVDINEITPVQYPADVVGEWKTTHHGYHDFEENLLKLDILGHDDPTMIRHLMNFVEENPQDYPFKTVEEIPLNDREVLKMFNSVTPLKVTKEQVLVDIGTTGLPEFGTQLAKDMLKEIRPTSVSELIKISGLSHGTNVWQGNCRDLFLGLKPKYGRIPIDKLICCRDDIMGNLISKGVPSIDAFTIMEKVRKGKGLTNEQETLMKKYGVEDYFIECAKAIKYLFPKAHATAYVIMALRIAWFKLYRPLQYYSGFFSKRAKAFDIETMAGGYDSILQKLSELSIKDSKKELTTKEEDIFGSLLVALEMTARGFTFKQIQIDKSDASNFLVDGNSLLIPFIAMDSLGESTAKMIVESRNDYAYTSKKDLARRGKVNNTVIENMTRMGILNDLPDEDQLGLFKDLKNINNE